MDQVPSVPNLLAGRGLLNLMIWVIIDECFEPIRWSCETLIVFVSRVRLRVGGDRRFKDRAPVISFKLRDWQTRSGGAKTTIREIITTYPVWWSLKTRSKLWEVPLLTRNYAHQIPFFPSSFFFFSQQRMLDPKDCGVTMTSSHKISFSIIDILDPKKFNSKRANELSIVTEKFPVPNAVGASVESDSTAGGDFRVERMETGRENREFESIIQPIDQMFTCLLLLNTHANFYFITTQTYW